MYRSPRQVVSSFVFLTAMFCLTTHAWCRETGSNVRDFLQKSESILYHPEDSGLTFLSFDVPQDFAPGRPLWTVSVRWSARDGAKVEGNLSEDVPITPASRDKIRSSFPFMGDSFLAYQLNRTATRLLLCSDATFAGTERGLTKVRFVPKPTAFTNFREKTLFFDAKFILKSAITLTSEGITLTETFTWRSVRSGSQLLILGSSTSQAVIKGATVNRVITYDYKAFDKWTLMSRITAKTTGLPKNPPDESLVFTNVIAKGNKR